MFLLFKLVYIHKYLKIIPTVSSLQISYFFDKRKFSRQMRLNVNICNEKITMKNTEYSKWKKEKKYSSTPNRTNTELFSTLCLPVFFSVLFSLLFFLHLYFAQRNVNETFHATGLRVQEAEPELSGEPKETGDTALELGRKEAC